jgi:hypothetical protein
MTQRLEGQAAERYVGAVEAEQKRNRLYEELLAAQLANNQNEITRLQGEIDELEGPGDL